MGEKIRRTLRRPVAWLIDGEVFYLYHSPEGLIDNREHFENHCEQLIDGFSGILCKKEMKKFIKNVLKRSALRKRKFK